MEAHVRPPANNLIIKLVVIKPTGLFARRGEENSLYTPHT